MSTYQLCALCLNWVSKQSMKRHVLHKHPSRSSDLWSSTAVISNYSSPDVSEYTGLDPSDPSDCQNNLEDVNRDRFIDDGLDDGLDDRLDDRDEELRCESLENAGLPVRGSLPQKELVVESRFAPFKNEDQWKLAMWALYPEPLSKPRLEWAILKTHASWGNPECLFETWGDWESRVNQVSAKGGQWERAFVLRSEKDPSWVPEALRFHKRNSLEILKEIVGDIKVVEHMKWAPEKVYNSKGERLYSELWTADWWWRKQEEISNSRPPGGDSVTIIPIILTSDKTLLSGNAKHKAWPLYMTIGNISNEVRFVPGKNAAKLIAFLPLVSGVETNYKNLEFRSWFRKTIHTILQDVLRPIETVMRTGMAMHCADGEQRLCFPVLCQYISDMEEQWLLVAQVRPSCPKCPKRNHHLWKPKSASDVRNTNARSSTLHRTKTGRITKSQSNVPTTAGSKVTKGGTGGIGGIGGTGGTGGTGAIRAEKMGGHGETQARSSGGTDAASSQRLFDPEAALVAQRMGRLRITEKRTDTEATKWRLDFRDRKCTAQQLHLAGYHPQSPFSMMYPFGGINDAVGPDLLHQATKCFMDVLFNKHIYPLVLRTWRRNSVIQENLDTEIDARYSLVPPWTGMRCFKEGIMAQTHQWSCHEFKDMMRQIIGCFVGLCPSEGISLLKEYLHIHRLSHYAVHTEESLGWLEDAVISFSDQLRAPAGPFARHLDDNGDFEVQRIHYFRHYADAVREKGALPSYSTDRTEIWHKWLKTSWFRSNHGEDALEFILREHTRRCAFQEMFDCFNDSPKDVADSGVKNPPPIAEEEEGVEFQEVSREAQDCVLWPKHPRKLWRTVQADQTEKLLELDGFHAAVKQYIQKKNSNLACDDECDEVSLNPKIYVYNTITVSYRPWKSEEIIRDESPQYVPPSQKAPKSDRLYASSLRHNTVLIRCPDRRARTTINTMSFKRVAQLLLLFQCRANGEKLQKLAYVSWFETKSGAADRSSGLYLVGRTKKTSVIPVKDIERGVHLIPKFGAKVGEAIKLKQMLSKEKAAWKIRMNTIPMDRRERSRLEVINERKWSSLSHYNDFWLNSWVDPHFYKNIF